MIPQKIAIKSEHGETPFSHSAFYEISTASNGTQRIVVGVVNGDPAVFHALATCLTPPYFILYVLHTPRGEGKAGRYKSPEITGEEFMEFMRKYVNFFQADSRFDLWARSQSSEGTVVWDRHNLIFGYGPVASYEQALKTIGYSEGKLDLEFPHEHFYRADFDDSAKSLLNYFKWEYSPLQPDDKQ